MQFVWVWWFSACLNHGILTHRKRQLMIFQPSSVKMLRKKTGDKTTKEVLPESWSSALKREPIKSRVEPISSGFGVPLLWHPLVRVLWPPFYVQHFFRISASFLNPLSEPTYKLIEVVTPRILRREHPQQLIYLRRFNMRHWPIFFYLSTKHKRKHNIDNTTNISNNTTLIY